MKKILLVLSLLTILLGCQKLDQKRMSSAGDWILIDAHVYIKRWGNYPLKKYNYFSPNQTYSNLDLTGNGVKLDEIKQFETKWGLPGDTYDFILNDTIVYETQTTASVMRVFPTENGSARIFILECLKEDYVRWRTSEREQALTIDGVRDNYTYYSMLTFRRINTNTPNNICPERENLPVSGTVPKNNMLDNILVGTKWVVYKYKWDGFNSYESISDTMTFLTNSTYYYANKNQKLGYALYDMGNYYSMSLDHTRFGANISSSDIPKFGIENGDVQNAVFRNNTVASNGAKVILFFRRIQ
jgi:hypothetical protein